MKQVLDGKMKIGKLLTVMFLSQSLIKSATSLLSTYPQLLVFVGEVQRVFKHGLQQSKHMTPDSSIHDLKTFTDIEEMKICSRKTLNSCTFSLWQDFDAVSQSDLLKHYSEETK